MCEANKPKTILHKLLPSSSPTYLAYVVHPGGLALHLLPAAPQGLGGAIACMCKANKLKTAGLAVLTAPEHAAAAVQRVVAGALQGAYESTRWVMVFSAVVVGYERDGRVVPVLLGRQSGELQM